MPPSLYHYIIVLSPFDALISILRRVFCRCCVFPQIHTKNTMSAILQPHKPPPAPYAAKRDAPAGVLSYPTKFF
jgi:hypothetical protein